MKTWTKIKYAVINRIYDIRLKKFNELNDKGFQESEKQYREVMKKSTHTHLETKNGKLLVQNLETDETKELDFKRIMKELGQSALTSSYKRDKYLVVGDDVIDLHGYVYEPTYECFEPTCSISLNDTVLYGLVDRNTSAYHNEIYSIGKFENLDKALDFLYNYIGNREVTIQMEKPEINNTYQFQYDLSKYCLPDNVEEIINKYGFAVEEKDGAIKFSLPNPKLNEPDFFHKALYCEEIKGTYLYNYAVNSDLNMIITSENSSYNKKVELQIFDTKEKFQDGVKAVEKTQEITEHKEEERKRALEEDIFQMTGQYPNEDYDLDDIDI